ncbi:MAG: glycoside hydrolase 43 family protein [Saprospiraceae bacterium]|nr:glycoside hydrolase 43 family protein [Saprospiraceae bacterium]
MKNITLFSLILTTHFLFAQVKSPDNGNGTYTNPIIHADYSDPDVVRVGEDYYLVASSFTCIPGLPILHSKDLVNWTLINHALRKQPPFDFHDKARHGGGVWAPAIRHHKGEFYIYYPDPDFGIYMVKTKDAKSTWSDPVLVQAGKGLIDPCPLWDDDGKAYLAYAYAGSRAGIKSILVIREMATDGTKLIGEAVLVFDGHPDNPTVEGPKLHKKDGFYYIFAPAGGVPTGWQLVLKSKNIYGPYTTKTVLAQGNTAINGPHQGAWVDTPAGEDWFIHFQDKGAYGRILHLQPMKWVNGFPVIGNDSDGDGKGEPVLTFKKPKTAPKPTPSVKDVKIPPIVEVKPFKLETGSDEFTQPSLNKYWQWHANTKTEWGFAYPQTGAFRLYAQPFPDSAATKNLRDLPSLLLQKFPAEQFKVTTKLQFSPNTEGDKIALLVWGHDYSYLNLVKKTDGLWLNQAFCKEANKGGGETDKDLVKIESNTIWLQVIVEKGSMCTFAYSLDGTDFKYIGDSFKAKEGHWIGAKVGLFCFRAVSKVNDAGFADIDFFRVE